MDSVNLKVWQKGNGAQWDYAFFPELIPHGPLPETLNKWDELTTKGQRVVAIGGGDAHAEHLSLGPLKKIIFPYEYHFKSYQYPRSHTHTPDRRPVDGTRKWSWMG